MSKLFVYFTLITLSFWGDLVNNKCKKEGKNQVGVMEAADLIDGKAKDIKKYEGKCIKESLAFKCIDRLFYDVLRPPS